MSVYQEILFQPRSKIIFEKYFITSSKHERELGEFQTVMQTRDAVSLVFIDAKTSFSVLRFD